MNIFSDAIIKITEILLSMTYKVLSLKGSKREEQIPLSHFIVEKANARLVEYNEWSFEIEREIAQPVIRWVFRPLHVVSPMRSKISIAE